MFLVPPLPGLLWDSKFKQWVLLIALKQAPPDPELKGKTKKDGVMVTFRNETGILAPVVARKPRRLYGLCDVDSRGQVRVCCHV